MRIEITADEANLIAARLGRTMELRTRRKAVNEAGASARRDLVPMLAALYSTSRAGIGGRGKAAAPGSDDPRYVLRVNRQIRLGKLKAAARRFAKGRGPHALGLLAVKQPQPSGAPGRDLFRARKGEERGEFILPARRGLRKRKAGGPVISLHRNPAIRARREQIVEDLAAAMTRQIEAALSKGRTR